MSVETQQANADRIVDGFKGKDKNSDFSHVMNEIIQLQNSTDIKDRAEFAATMKIVNAELDMRDYGFPTDEELLRVNENGRLLTQSGNQINARELVHLQLEGGRTITTGTETWGKRDFQTSTDGSAQYKVAKGDNLWGISRDILTEKFKNEGREGKPSQNEINDFYRSLAEANGIKDPNKLKIGQSLTIPQGTTEKAAMPEVKGASLSPNDPDVEHFDNSFNAMAGPGLPGGDSDWIMSGTLQQTSERPGEGMTVSKYKGQIDGWSGNNPTFEASQTTDRYGKVTSSNVKYDGDGLNTEFEVGNNQQPISLDGVKEIDTALMMNGNYESTIRLADGSLYRSTTDATGKVIEFKQL